MPAPYAPGITGLFKVLDQHGYANNGGDYQYDLPQDGKPGKWTKPIKRRIKICNDGYHLTRDPLEWYDSNARLFVAEGRGEYDLDNYCGDKIAFESVRLLEEVTPKWKGFKLFPEAMFFLSMAGKCRVRLDRVNLFTKDFTHSTLRYLNLYNSRLCQIKFLHSNLLRANWEHVIAIASPLVGASLTSAKFISCRFRDVEFIDSKFRGTQFHWCHFDNCDFTGVQVADVNMGNLSKFVCCKFKNCKGLRYIKDTNPIGCDGIK